MIETRQDGLLSMWSSDESDADTRWCRGDGRGPEGACDLHSSSDELLSHGSLWCRWLGPAGSAYCVGVVCATRCSITHGLSNFSSALLIPSASQSMTKVMRDGILRDSLHREQGTILCEPSCYGP